MVGFPHISQSEIILGAPPAQGSTALASQREGSQPQQQHSQEHSSIPKRTVNTAVASSRRSLGGESTQSCGTLIPQKFGILARPALMRSRSAELAAGVQKQDSLKAPHEARSLSHVTAKTSEAEARVGELRSRVDSQSSMTPTFIASAIEALSLQSIATASRVQEERLPQSLLFPSLAASSICSIIEGLHEKYLIFSCDRTGSPLAFDQPLGRAQDLSAPDEAAYHKLKCFLEEYNVNSLAQVHVEDGAKKTVLIKGAPLVLKMYSVSSAGVYLKEQANWALLQRKGAQHLFVRQEDWDSTSLTARAERLDCDANHRALKPPKGDRFQQEAEKIQAQLRGYGLTYNDFILGDNIGFVQGQPKVFDLKSLAELR